MSDKFTRRDAMKTMGLTASSLLLPSYVFAEEKASTTKVSRNVVTLGPSPTRKKLLRIAHITDAHVDGHKGSEDGLRKCLQHIQTIDSKPDMILNTGDVVMCVNKVDKSEARRQWKLSTDIFKSENNIPMHSYWAIMILGPGKNHLKRNL